MLTFDDFPRIKRKVDAAKSTVDRLKGARDELLARLKKEFGCSTVEEAEVLLDRLKAEEQAAMAKYVKARKRFLAEWKDKTGEDL